MSALPAADPYAASGRAAASDARIASRAVDSRLAGTRAASCPVLPTRWPLKTRTGGMRSTCSSQPASTGRCAGAGAPAGALCSGHRAARRHRNRGRIVTRRGHRIAQNEQRFAAGRFRPVLGFGLPRAVRGVADDKHLGGDPPRLLELAAQHGDSRGVDAGVIRVRRCAELSRGRIRLPGQPIRRFEVGGRRAGSAARIPRSLCVRVSTPSVSASSTPDRTSSARIRLARSRSPLRASASASSCRSRSSAGQRCRPVSATL